MSDGKIFTKETTDLIVKAISDGLSKKVPFFARPLLKPAVKIAVNTLSKYGDKVIPDKVDDLINEAITLGFAKDFDGAAEAIGEAGDMLVNIPGIDDEHEKKLFISIAQAIVNGIETWIKNKK